MKSYRSIILNALLIAVLLVSCSSPSESYGPEQIIGTPNNIGNFEVAQNDFTKKMNWYYAKKACADLGNGWRLPTKDELNLLYKNKDKIGGFADNVYWSSSNEASSSTLAWKQGFDYGDQHISNKYDTKYVRAIRTF